MRLVLDGRIVIPRMTGAGRYVIELARRVPRLANDVTVEVLLLPVMRATSLPTELADARVKVHFVNVAVASLGQWFVVPRVLERLRPDLYHYPFFDLPFVRTPSVVTIYDLNPILHADYFGNFKTLKRAAARALLRSTMRRSRGVLAISEATSVLLRERYPEAAWKIRAIPLGVDMDTWLGPRTRDGRGAAPHIPTMDHRTEWGGRDYALYVGVDRPHKNLVRLVRAFGRFRGLSQWQSGQGPYLWLAGVGGGSGVLRAEIAALALARDVRFAPALPEEDLRAAYLGATVIAYVSTSEGFGLPVLEGFAAGVPVLAANSSSLPEVGGNAALYANPHDEVEISDALARIWTDIPLRRTLVERGRERAAQFSWDATAANTVEAYRDALQAKVTPS